MNVLIADDHPLVREGVRHSLARIDENATIVEAANFTVALGILDSTSNFDLIIVDLSMPGMERFNGLRRVISSAGEIPVVVFSGSEDLDDVRQAMRCGARGFIPKSSANQILVAALTLVLSGGIYVPPALLDYDPPGTTGDESVPPVLTRRQREVIHLLVQGKTNKEICKELGLSPGTIRTHLAAIFDVLNVTNRTEASHVARTIGILD